MALRRSDAYALLTEYTKNDNLIKHALGVEAAMRFYARKLGQEEELFGLTGLLHDFDYERWPDPADHPLKGCRILTEKGYPPEMIHAIQGHANYLNVPRESTLDRALFAVDELVGFITAVALVRPSKKVADVEVKSVRKKLKDKAFARTCSREDIETGAKELGLDLDTHIGNVLEAMKGVADQLGL
ncbi:MAG: HDIG domain-containing protein [Planctomycetes bacterium]|nr:HDIG domain-containing protein [Planctomycetota bacterium]